MDPEDKECNEPWKNARTKLEVQMDSAMPCKLRNTSGNGSLKSALDPEEEIRHGRERSFAITTTRKKGKHVYAYKCEAHESTRTRTGKTQNKDHEDHIAEREFNSMSHYHLVRRPVPVLQAMKILGAKAGVDNKWERLKKFFSVARIQS